MSDAIRGAPEVDGVGGTNTDAWLFEQVSEVFADQVTDPE